MKAFMTFTWGNLFEVPQRNFEIKVYVNFILINCLETPGTVRVNITESNGMLVDTLFEN